MAPVRSRTGCWPRSAARRPDVDPAEVIPVDLAGVQRTVERFVEVGFSKFVLVPVVEPPSWPGELEELAERVLPLQLTAA